MRRTTLAGALLAGKGFDAVSTVVVLSLSDSVREAVPLSRALMAAFGPAGGMAVLTLLVLAIFVPLAETGALVERRWPEETPDWYAPSLRTAVYLVPAAWFALVGARNLTHLL